MRAGGHYSDFKSVIERPYSNSRLPRPHPPIRALEGVGLKCHIFTVLHLKSEKFGENLKIHAGGDDKLRVQFAPPNLQVAKQFTHADTGSRLANSDRSYHMAV